MILDIELFGIDLRDPITGEPTDNVLAVQEAEGERVAAEAQGNEQENLNSMDEL